MTTADKVRDLVKKSNGSQKAFADSVGIHPVSFCKCLKNDNFSMKSLKRIADHQGISIDSLLPDSAPKEAVSPAPSINGYIEYEGEIEAIRSVEEKAFTKKCERKQANEDMPKYNICCSDEGYAYFYMDVPLSNWWDSVPAIQYDGHTFNASESIFVYLKAKHFNDAETAAKIVKADNKTYAQSESRWRAVKNLGRKVKGLNYREWTKYRQDAMYTALKQKAQYDEEFRRVLLDPQYAGLTFVEASKYDPDWGIGIDARTAMKVGRAGWKGQNLLGRALTKLRNELRPDLEKVQKIR